MLKLNQELKGEGLPLNPTVQPNPTPEQHSTLTRHVFRQTQGGRVCHVNSWVQAREAAYYASRPTWPFPTFTYAACRDLACAWFDADERETLVQIRILNQEGAR